jgi:endonuclease/exonuclease/phosphatase family metal-dependent hydrolase
MKKLFKIVVHITTLTVPAMLLLGCYSIHVDPLESKLFPLIAYGFPYIFLLNSLSLLFLLFLKSWKLFTLNVLIIVFSFSYFNNYFAFGDSEDTVDSDLKILSYNVRCFNIGDVFEIPREVIRDSIFEFIAAQDAEIYCFQEMYHEHIKRKYAQLSEIKNITKTNFYASTENDVGGRNRYVGSYIFSKYPILNHGVVELNTGELHQGKCLFADIKLPDNQMIRIYNFHLASLRYQKQEYDFVENLNSEVALDEQNKVAGKRVISMFLNAAKRRSKELAIVLKHASQSPYPTVLCGDLNDTPTSNAYHRFQENYLDAFLQAGKGFGMTYSGRMPSNRIDYIFHSQHFKTVNFEIQKEVLSDHQGISAYLRWK